MPYINRYSARALTAVFSTVIVLAAGANVWGTESAAPAEPTETGEVVGQSIDPTDQPKKGSDSVPLETIKKMVQDIKVCTVEDDSRVQLELQGPLLVSGIDRHAKFADGTMWLWRGTGRPPTVLSLSTNPGKTEWCYEFISLAAGAIQADIGGALTWSPKESGWNPMALPEAPPPAATKTGRLRQMKTLARRFTAEEIYADDSPWSPGEHWALRLLTQPIYRYGEANGSTLDGAIFAFCKAGTNPEALLTIELHKPSSGDPVWQYNFSPVTVIGLSAKLSGKQVWEREQIGLKTSTRTDPYWVYWRPFPKGGRRR